MPRPFNKEKFFENLQGLLSVIIKLGPVIFAEGQPLMRASAEGDTPDAVEAECRAAFENAPEAPQVEPGKFGGPIVDEGIRSAIRSLAGLLLTNTEAAVDIYNRVVKPYVPKILDI